MERIVGSYHSGTAGQGRAIGNLTSQFFANFYLAELDHTITAKMDILASLRYVDDLVLLADSKSQLWEAAEKISQQMMTPGLTLHPEKVQVCRSTKR